MKSMIEGKSIMSINVHREVVGELEQRILELDKNQKLFDDENKQLKQMLSVYKVTCRDLRLKVGQSMTQMINW